MESSPPIGQRSLDWHKKLRGKISIVPKAPVKTLDDLALAYTPGVGAVSSYLAEHKDEVRDYAAKGNLVAVVSDGSAVLGLGNIGPEGAIPVMEGKCMLFKELADIDAFPIVLATQDTEAIVETVKNFAPMFGGINLEDIAAPRCFEIERRLQGLLDIPVMHDDQHGTAIVVLAGMLNAAKVVGKAFADMRIAVIGAGAAGNAVSRLLLRAGVGDVTVCDRKGILSVGRDGLDAEKSALAAVTNKAGMRGGIADAVAGADAVIGLSGPGLLTPDHIRSMAPRSIVFALANPTPEIMPDEAKAGGAAVVATGRSDYPNQVNNALGFPGIFRGALDHGVRRITPAMEEAAARALAAVIAEPTAERIIPSPFDPAVVPAVANAIR